MSFGLTDAEFERLFLEPVSDGEIPKLLVASEALAEVIRRTTAQLQASGQVSSAEAVLTALQADLVDGVVDGLGAAAADARIAAVSHVVTAQVLLESITNTLAVNGVDAAGLLDSAIQQILSIPDPSLTTDSVLVSVKVLQQASDAVYAAMGVDDDPMLGIILERLGTIYPDTSPATVAAMLPVDSNLSLEPVIAYVKTADGTDLEKVNKRPRGKALGWNREPIISGTPDLEVAVANLYSFTPNAADPDGDPLSFSIQGKPAWASFDPATGRLHGQPGPEHEGTFGSIEIAVSDGKQTSALAPFDIAVTRGANRAPSIGGAPPGQVTVGNSYSFTPNASDADGDPLSFSIQGKPDWAGFDSATGRLWGTPTVGDEGTYDNIAITADDGIDSTSLTAFAITVTVEPNEPPVISGTPASEVMVGASYSFTPGAADADGDSLGFTIQNQPAWMDFDAGTGRLSGVPGGGNVGTYSGIVISVSDGRDSASLPAFSIAVLSPPNQPPMITGTPPATALEGAQYEFTPSASDPDGDPLSFSIQGRPAWASFNSQTGRLQGVPGADDVRSYDNIIISVTDGQDSRSLAPFSIAVSAAPNQPPTITANIVREVAVGSTYSLTPSASDPDGDVLTFSIQNRPPWASFDTNSGRLQGTPDAADVGKYDAVRIFVSDGQESAQLTSFSITVLGTATAGFTLNWDPPVSNEDGSALNDLNRYHIYVGTQSGNYPDMVVIDSPGVTSHVFDNLAPGSYYLVITAVDLNGNESVPSAEVSTTL
jgi:hypothetical protein